MIFPLRTDRRLIHPPWINLLLIAVNIIVFMLQMRGATRGNPWWEGLQLYPIAPEWYQFFTYQFLHGGWEHLLGNMVFLYVFGNSVEDRFGPLGYLCFYLAGGVVAALGHSIVDAHPILGASGSVSAVTGAFLALFPNTRVMLLIFFYVTEVASGWLILLFFVKDLVYQLLDVSGVAYLAHISGNVFGFGIALSLLAGRILSREPYDLIALVSHWNRRRYFRTIAKQGQGRGESPWRAHGGGRVKVRPVSENEQALLALRSEVEHHLREHEFEGALVSYRRLIELDPRQTLSRQSQLDIANIAMKAGQYDLAAQAYELYLELFGDDDFATDARLVLGLLYTRHLDDAARARGHLKQALRRLHDPNRRRMAEAMLEDLGPGEAGVPTV